MKLADLKVGDELPLDTLIDEMWVPVFGDGPPRFICLKDVPVAALCAEHAAMIPSQQTMAVRE